MSSSLPPSLPVSPQDTEEYKLEHDSLSRYERGDINLGECCFEIGLKFLSMKNEQKSVSWLRRSAGERYREGEIALGGLLLFGRTRRCKYERDEGILYLNNISERWRIVPRDEGKLSLSLSLSSMRKIYTHTLLLGFLDKNKQTSLSRSFFKSSMTEVHLLSLISRYLPMGEREREKERVTTTSYFEDLCARNQNTLTDVHSVVRLLLQKPESLSLSLYVTPSSLSHSISPPLSFDLLPYFSLLSPLHTSRIEHLTLAPWVFAPFNLSFLSEMQFPSLLSLSLYGHDIHPVDRFSLSLSPLSSWKVPRLEKLDIRAYQLLSLSSIQNWGLENLTSLSLRLGSSLPLSSLSLCSFPSLSHLSLLHAGESSYRNLKSWTNLDGFSNANMPRLISLSLSSPSLIDISSLSLCDLSRLRELEFSQCYELSDISPLGKCDLSSLSSLSFSSSGILSLSPLSLCPDLGNLKSLNGDSTKLTSLSPLSSFKNFSPSRLSFIHTEISDLSFLSLSLCHSLECLSLLFTKIADLSPLLSLSPTLPYFRLEIAGTPAGRGLHSKGETSPLAMENVNVEF